MRKKILFTLWLLVPVALLAYHFGPGQSRLNTERAAKAIAEARALEAAESWPEALEAWTEALAATPSDKPLARFQLRLAHANARIYAGELPEAMEDMEKLLAETQTAKADVALQREVRSSLGSARYYAAWLMRLEGATPDEWLVQSEGARQHFRLLAEETKDAKLVADYKKNLEATVRLEQMDLSELQGLPLPKKCSGCKNVCQKCRGQSKSKCENPGEKEKKDARGAGFNDVPKGGS
jgi:tetratricopeptide (TPR) repeat protein